MSVENDAWDAIAKERGNYIDKARLMDRLSYLKEGYTQIRRYAAADIIYHIIREIESGTFDIQEDTP
jgi:hypothetical protein